MEAKILITGADSYIGTSFEKYLQKWQGEYRVDTIDMKDNAWREMSFGGYDAVFHVAGIAHSDNGKISEEKKNRYYQVNTQLCIQAAEKAKAEGVGQFIFMSSAIVYGNSAAIGTEKNITKNTPVAPANVYADSKVRAEEGIQRLESDTFRVVILRPPMIYGKGCKGNYRTLAAIAKKMPVFPLVNNQRSMLYIENLCEFVRLMVENRESGIFWPQNDMYSSTSELVAHIGSVHGKRPYMLSGFNWALKLMGRFTGLVDKAFGNMTYDQQMSVYKEEYRLVGLEESIRRTEL